MLQTRALTFKLRPCAQAIRRLECAAGACRWVWNEGVALAAICREARVPRPSYATYCKLLTLWRQHHPWLAESPVMAEQQALRALDRAFKDAFTIAERGFPQFKKRGRARDSVRFAKDFRIDAENGRVMIPKIGWVPFRMSRAITGDCKQIAVCREADGWYVTLFVERDVDVPTHPASGIVCGVDVGVSVFAALSDGGLLDGPRPLAGALRQRAQLQRRFSRKQRGSMNAKKAARRLAQFDQRLARIRSDFLHKTSRALAETQGVLVLEDLRVQRMTASARGTVARPGRRVRQKAGLNRAILDQGWGMFGRMLDYKASEMGGHVLRVPAPFTSQTCSTCGHVAKESRISRDSFACVSCGYEAQADVNAACNIRAAGLAVLACGGDAQSGAPTKQEPARRQIRRLRAA